MKFLPRLAPLILLLASVVSAQQAAPTNDVERETKRASEAQKQATTAQQASAASTDGGVTYEQVLANPDDVELNYRYAKGQIASGDLKGASATLERVLMIKPELHKVRLVYAVVLYRLGNLSEAERELTKLEAAGVPDAIKTEAEGYRKAVTKGRKKNHLGGSVALGFEYDTNRNASPASGRRLFNGLELNVTGTGQRRDDTAALIMLGVDYRRDLRHAAEAFVSANYFRSEQTLLNPLDLQAYSLQGGLVLRPWARWELTPKLMFDHVLLSQSTFLRNRGFSLRAERRVTRRHSVYGEISDVFNDFVRTPLVPSAQDRTGAQIDFSLGVHSVLTPTMRLTTEYKHGTKTAREAFWAFDRDALSFTHTWLLGRGAFLVSTLEGRYDRYRRPETSISQGYRKDTTTRLSFLAGTPLTCVHLKDVVATLNYEYYHALSTLTNYAYSNNKISALLSYRWDAGF